MKVLILFVVIVILISCSITQLTKQDSYNISTHHNYYPITDSIFIGTGYVFVGTSSKFAGTIDDHIPFALKKAPLEYSKLAKENKIEGDVILQVEVLADGTVGRVVVKQSLMPGPDGLDEAAVNSVKKWIFSPAKYEGKSVASWTTIAVYFILE